MSAHEMWSSFFKPEVRKQGLLYFQKGAVFLKTAADTQIQALIKGTTSVRVTLSATSIASPAFDAGCTCPSSKKGQLCKHIWATLLAVEKNYPDFLDSKIELNKAEISPSKTALGQPDIKEAFKTKQADFRKQQYQRQKEIKKAKKTKTSEPIFPDEIQEAIQFFAQNGFTFTNPINPMEVQNARKVLARVFHPDKGGTHAEALLLNENYEVLMAWAGRL